MDKKRSGWMTGILLACCLAAALAGCGGGGGGNDGPGPSPRPTSTPQSQAIDFSDDFSDPTSGWDVHEIGGDYEYGYSAGVYYFRMSQAGERASSSKFRRILQNYQVEVDCGTNGDNSPICGIYFNSADTPDNYSEFYVFAIAPKRKTFGVKVYERDGGEWSRLRTLVYTQSEWINTTDPNRLKIEMNNGTAVFYINGQQVYTTTVITHSDGESVGFYVSNDFDGYTDAWFDNFHVVGTELVP
jgi:hypothetical protein